MVFLLLLSCRTPVIDTATFENSWWQIESQNWCFNFLEDADTSDENKLIMYEAGQYEDSGIWSFEEPNEYWVDDQHIEVLTDGDCWDVNLNLVSHQACECKLELRQTGDFLISDYKNIKLPIPIQPLQDAIDVGVPDYIDLSSRYYEKYIKTCDSQYLSYSRHYLKVAEEVGLCLIEENETQEFFLDRPLTK